ncbi:MAG: glycoside hydrolase family 3 C-terminal domain-containing protein, partial [Clostridia bacterium]
GGGGSGNFTSEYYLSLMEGLENKKAEGKIELYDDLYSMYKSVYDNYWKNDGRTYAYGSKQGAVIMYQGETSITQAQADAAAQNADTAIITIGRPAGESGDRSSGKGDFLLSDKETDMIEKVKNAGFKKIVAILNVAGVTDTNWLKDGIDAALLVYFPGMEGGNAIADVLCGDSYPSGKLADTWAKNYSDYPSSSNFGNSSYTNYEEDIFVGYRYFETIPGAAEKVNYEFGYGLSYADFSIDNVSVSTDDENITVSADVTNVSTQYSGKEVLQVYYGAPEGALTQSARELSAFEKTSELKPGETQRLTLSFPVTDMASYDDTGKTGYEAAYVLEKGEYKIYVGSSVRDCALVGTYTVSETTITEQLSHRLVPDVNLLTKRLTSSGEYETLTQTEAADKTPEKAETDYASPPQSDDKFITFNEVAKDNSLLQTFVSRLNDDELIKLVGCTNPATGQRTGIGGIDVYGVPVIGTANGPAGIQYNGGSQTDPERNTTFFPCATMQASTWNTKLIETLGKAIALEAKHFGMSLWQAPGMNIHRN